MRISIGVIIAIILIAYWYHQDHPGAFQPAKQGSLSQYEGAVG